MITYDNYLKQFVMAGSVQEPGAVGRRARARGRGAHG